MPAASKAQQRLFGMIHAIQKGNLNPEDTKDPEKLKKIAGSIKKKDAEKFARTKHKGLPDRKVKESKISLDACPDCGGKGKVEVPVGRSNDPYRLRTCETCGGKGKVEVPVVENEDLPTGEYELCRTCFGQDDDCPDCDGGLRDVTGEEQEEDLPYDSPNHLQVADTCPDCGGTGVNPEYPAPGEPRKCPSCRGYGEVFETRKLTFKQYLIEITQKQRDALVPPAAIQKLYNQIKQKHGMVKRDVFLHALADRLNLTPEGLKRLATLPAIQALPFHDPNQRGVERRDPWDHIRNKHSRSEATANRQLAGNKGLSQEKLDIIKRLGG